MFIMANEEKQAKNSKPWDLLNLNIKRVPKNVENERLFICKKCPLYNSISKTCVKCGCFMILKVKLSNSFCPINKWNVYQ